MTFYWWGPWEGQTLRMWAACLSPVALAALLVVGVALVRAGAALVRRVRRRLG